MQRDNDHGRDCESTERELREASRDSARLFSVAPASTGAHGDQDHRYKYPGREELARMAAQDQIKSRRRTEARDLLRDSVDADEARAVKLAERGYSIDAILALTGVTPRIARLLVTGERK